MSEVLIYKKFEVVTFNTAVIGVGLNGRQEYGFRLSFHDSLITEVFCYFFGNCTKLSRYIS